MSAPTSPAQRPRRSRKSIAHVPSGGAEFSLESTTASKQSAKAAKKSRSKSLGPGGLKALQEASGNSQKLLPAIRSILKPVIPISPPKAIPPRAPRSDDIPDSSPTRRTRSSTARASQSPSKQPRATNNADESRNASELVALRTEEEQAAAARAREREEAVRRRDERRKSLANRRVSFAPEATLHTWDVVELNEDATTSSEATNSTRRQSHGDTLGSDFTHGTQGAPDPSIMDEPSTPLVLDHAPGSPDDPSNLPHMQRRRSTGPPQFDENNGADLSSSPGSIMADDVTQSSFVTNPEEEEDISDTDTYRDDDSTAMDLDQDEDNTGTSANSGRSDDTSSSSSSAQLDARLRQAVQQAGTQRLEDLTRSAHNAQDDETMSVPEAIRQKHFNETLIDADFVTDKENEAGDDETGAMEMTEAVGGLLNRSPSRSPSRRVSRRRSSGVSAEDQTMDFTTAEGFIRRTSTSSRRESVATVATEDEDMSMELTGVIGGLVNAQHMPDADENTHEVEYPDITGQMEVTTALGRILPKRGLSPVTERTEPSTVHSMSMDFTTAVGAIQHGPLVAIDSTATMDVTTAMDVTNAVGRILSAEVTEEDSTALMDTTTAMDITQGMGRILRPSTRQNDQSEASDTTATMDMTRATSRILQSAAEGAETTPARSQENDNERETAEVKKLSPALAMARRASAASPASKTPTTTPQRLTEFSKNNQQAVNSPLALLDRRVSIGDSAEVFTPLGAQKRGVHFIHPRELELEDVRSEDDQAQDQDSTASLRDKINSLTPKKKNLNGRKSLAVGSARGLLGKRPAELDEDEEYSPKRLQGPDHSPVKSIRLPAPPSKEETTGRLGRVPRLSLGPPGNAGILLFGEAPAQPATPQPRRKTIGDMVTDDSVAVPRESLEGANDKSTTIEDDSFDPIHLQDFLTMINVRFMDLETTKRRHTLAPSDASKDTAGDDRKLEECVVAGVSTVPMLELYQHSCRELKKYISEGREIVREIESDTYEDNPALFREYMTAVPDMRGIMDNQFKNVKTHARLLSKDMWYEWRKKLLDGLKDGLIKIAEGLIQDADSLSRQEQVLARAMPKLTESFDRLSSREEALKRQAEEFAAGDEEQLKETRLELASADADWEEKKQILAKLKAEQASQDEHLQALTTRKQQCLLEIAESQKLCDDFRGWKMSEVAQLKAEMDKIGAESGWTIAAAVDDALILHYRDTLSLKLRPSSFSPASSESSPLRLSLRSDAEPTTQERFFLQLISARLQVLDRRSIPISDALRLVSNGWNFARRLRSTVSDLALSYITDVEIIGDDTIAILANILLREMRTKVRVRLELKVFGEGSDFDASFRSVAQVIYGEELKEGNMGQFLKDKMGTVEEQGFNQWGGAVRELETRLIARGKKSSGE